MGLFGKKYTIETLQKAILSGNIDEAKTCIEKGVDLNGPYRLPPLYIAVAQDNLELVKLFIEKGAKVDPDMGPNSSDTVLSTACASGCVEIVDYLLSKGADANKKTGTGFSPLWIAASKGKASICDKLIAKGADAKDCADTLKAFKDSGLATPDSRNVEKFLATLEEEGEKSRAAAAAPTVVTVEMSLDLGNKPPGLSDEMYVQMMVTYALSKAEARLKINLQSIPKQLKVGIDLKPCLIGLIFSMPDDASAARAASAIQGEFEKAKAANVMDIIAWANS